MKKLFVLFLLVFFGFTGKAQFNNQARIGNVDFVYLADKVSIKYEFIDFSFYKKTDA